MTPHRHRPPENGSLLAALVLLIVFTLALGAAVVTAAERGRIDGRRTLGYGQIAYAGAGPERWAQRWRAEHHKVALLEQRLTKANRRNLQQRRVLPARGLVRDFLCVYDGENGGYGWSANTGNGYYGGLQMDLDFQRTWGLEFFREWGTADRWAPEVQLAVAIKGWFHRGWQPWPNTARACGLR